MHQKEGGRQPTVITDGDGVHHTRGVGNSIEPKCPRHLFLCDVRACHVNHRLPMGFDQPIGRLAFGRGGNHLRSVTDKILADGSTKKFAITIAVEATGKRARIAEKISEDERPCSPKAQL